MKDFRTKIAVAAVVFGLGGLGGFAIASNPAGHGQAEGDTGCGKCGYRHERRHEHPCHGHPGDAGAAAEHPGKRRGPG